MTKLLAEPGAGEQLARYELVAEIASGGMATVYLARAIGIVDFRRFFAIKRLHPHLNKDADFVAMFLDEARLAARIHHPNVVPIFEIGVKDEQYFLVMDYVEGDTASRLVIRSKHLGRTLPIGFTTRVLVETLAGLHAAHELTSDDGAPLEIVHRDVSPQNILVGVDGVARITDFGVARAAARIGDQTQGGQLKGKLAYMAPEQIRGGVIDRRVDVFAAGIVLWEMLAGERLFKAETEGETLFKVAAAEVPDLVTIVPALPLEIAAVCHRALSKDPNDRYATAADFGDALEAAARAAGHMFTGRESAALVNDLVGQDITAHRDLVRTWLTRSDVSRSGIALTQSMTPPIPQVNETPPAARSGAHPTPPPETPAADIPPAADTPLPPLRDLGNLISDHEELATRIDMDIDEAPMVDANGLPATPPAPPPSVPLAMPHIPPLATLPEFAPLGATAVEPHAPPVSAPPSSFGAPAPTPSFVPPSRPAQGRTLPLWTLAIPIGLLVVVAVVAAAIKLSGGTTPPQPSTTTVTDRHVAPTVTDTAPPLPAAATTPTLTTTTATTTTEPTASVVATTTPTATTKPTAAPSTTIHKPKPIDNSSFGGRK